MENWYTQEIALFLSTLFLVASLYMVYVGKIHAKWIYMSSALGHLGAVIYYCAILFFDSKGHSFSSILRVFQTISFGAWVLTSSISNGIRRARRKNLKTRMQKCLSKSSRYLSQSD